MQVVTTQEFETEVLGSSVPVLVDFFATWCGPCKMIAPILEQLSTEVGEAAKIVKVDVDQSQDLAGRYGVMAVPTMIIFKNGEVADKVAGALPKDVIKSKLNAVL